MSENQTNTNKNKSLWMKRVNVFQQIYSNLIYPVRADKFLETCAGKYEFDANQLKIMEYYLTHKDSIKNEVQKYIKSGWTFDSLNFAEQAIIYCAVSESKALNTDKAVIIMESIKTAKNFCDYNSYEFINAILDKLI